MTTDHSSAHRTQDFWFSGFVAAVFSYRLLEWFQGHGDAKRLAAIGLFAAFNIGASIHWLRASEPARVEVPRLLGNALVFCPLVAVWGSGPGTPFFAPFWMLMLAIVFPLQLFKRRRRLMLAFIAASMTGLAIACREIAGEGFGWVFAEQALLCATLFGVMILVTDLVARAARREAGNARRLELAVARLRTAQARLVQAEQLRALGQLAGGLAHEINTPVTIMRLYAARIIDDLRAGKDRTELAALVQRMDATSGRMTRIVQALRAYAGQGGEDEPVVDVELARVVADAFDLCGERARAYGVELRLARPVTARARGRASALLQVLVNLINNGIDSAGAGEGRWVELQVVAAAPRTEIRVSDGGAGVPEADREKIFQPFFTTKGVGAGTGLGLSLSRRLVERQGGLLTYDAGAARPTFVVSIPSAGAR